MKKFIKENKLTILTILTIVLSLGLNIVYAKTSAKLSICAYPGTLRMFKILGILIIILKIVVPLLVMITAIIAFVQPIMSGKADDIKAKGLILVKKLIAGLAIFIIPTVLPSLFETLIPDYDDSDIYACTTCLFDVDNCTIPASDPVIYTD